MRAREPAARVSASLVSHPRISTRNITPEVISMVGVFSSRRCGCGDG
jgi:hypothetical protein